ncbi:unnamed protein product [Calicophoron daubneyi]|uniref:ATP-grasp domain-containing protein n=1 Tax=Calicophoron daubneyi TaxID=300641 RepID=A0AAV2TFJ0_CALDB
MRILFRRKFVPPFARKTALSEAVSDELFTETSLSAGSEAEQLNSIGQVTANSVTYDPPTRELSFSSYNVGKEFEAAIKEHEFSENDSLNSNNLNSEPQCTPQIAVGTIEGPSVDELNSTKDSETISASIQVSGKAAGDCRMLDSISLVDENDISSYPLFLPRGNIRSLPPPRISLRDGELEMTDSKVSLRRFHSMREDSTLNSVNSPGTQEKADTGLINKTLLKQAKQEADEAIRNRKVFAILGPYQQVRRALRRRGWVEKFYSTTSPTRKPKDSNHTNGEMGHKRLPLSRDHEKPTDAIQGDLEDPLPADLDDEDSENGPFVPASVDGPKIPPWEERDGYYGLMSRMMRSVVPNFIWSLRKNQVDFRFLRKDQIVNHHCRAPFTTKVGLCRNLHQVRWVDDIDASAFFPRCYVLTDEDDKQAFVDDFRLTACISLLKLITIFYREDLNKPASPRRPENPNPDQNFCSPRVGRQARSRPNSARPCTPELSGSLSDLSNDDGFSSKRMHNAKSSTPLFYVPPVGREDSPDTLPSIILDMAIARCDSFLRFKYHKDIDQPVSDISDKGWPWENFLGWLYKVSGNITLLSGMSSYARTCRKMCMKIKKFCPQFYLDGTRNIWIVKPGAKSRGRGIACYNRLEDMLRLTQNHTFAGDCRFVVQKYVETPLLIYNTKFDVRQWFLVTDWAPLTVWWYRDCYLRFCSQRFTLDSFSEAVHLSNNSIQYKYTNGPRSEKLPDENMWTIDKFKEWLKEQGHPTIWEEKLLVDMKRAIINALLCAQDDIEIRKNCFGLYGADFLFTEDYNVWLIEINASPCMAPSTSVTAKLTANVLEDTLKVVLDRRSDRNCDVGRYDMIYRQVMSGAPQYTGMELRVEGVQIHQPVIEGRGIAKQQSCQPEDAQPSLFISKANHHQSRNPFTKHSSSPRPNPGGRRRESASADSRPGSKVSCASARSVSRLGNPNLPGIKVKQLKTDGSSRSRRRTPPRHEVRSTETQSKPTKITEVKGSAEKPVDNFTQAEKSVLKKERHSAPQEQLETNVDPSTLEVLSETNSMETKCTFSISTDMVVNKCAIKSSQVEEHVMKPVRVRNTEMKGKNRTKSGRVSPPKISKCPSRPTSRARRRTPEPRQFSPDPIHRPRSSNLPGPRGILRFGQLSSCLDVSVTPRVASARDQRTPIPLILSPLTERSQPKHLVKHVPMESRAKSVKNGVRQSLTVSDSIADPVEKFIREHSQSASVNLPTIRPSSSHKQQKSDKQRIVNNKTLKLASVFIPHHKLLTADKLYRSSVGRQMVKNKNLKTKVSKRLRNRHICPTSGAKSREINHSDSAKLDTSESSEVNPNVYDEILLEAAKRVVEESAAVSRNTSRFARLQSIGEYTVLGQPILKPIPSDKEEREDKTLFHVKTGCVGDSDLNTVSTENHSDKIQALHDALRPFGLQRLGVLDYKGLSSKYGEETIDNSNKSLNPTSHLRCVLHANMSPMVNFGAVKLQTDETVKSSYRPVILRFLSNNPSQITS